MRSISWREIKTCIRCGQDKTKREFCAYQEEQLFPRDQLCLNCYSWQKMKVKTHNKRAMETGAIGDLTVMQWLNILWEAQGECRYCHAQVGLMNLTIDHDIPIIQGGANSVSNIIAVCKECNTAKGKKTFDEWMEFREYKQLLQQIQEKLNLNERKVTYLAIRTLAQTLDLQMNEF